MKPATTSTAPAIRFGNIEARQNGDTIIITHHGKANTVNVAVPASSFERWALRQLREQVFAQ